MEEVERLNHGVTGSLQDQKHEHGIGHNSGAEKLSHGTGALFATEKLSHGTGALSATEKLSHENGIWAPLEEYLRVEFLSRTTIYRYIQQGVFKHPIRKNLKLCGQKGAGYEVYITDNHIIKKIISLQRRRAGGLERKKEKAKLQEAKSIVNFQVPSEIYMAGAELRQSEKMTFSEYLKIALSLGKNMVHRHRQIHVKVEKKDHEAVSILAKEAGINISNTYKILYEQYVANIYKP